MHIDPDEKLAGYRQIEIRDLLRQLRNKPDGWEISLIEKSLHVSCDEAINLAKELKGRDFIRSGGRISKRNLNGFRDEELTIWELTDKGRRFAKASTEWISREQAREIISSLLKRIEQANQNPEIIYTISRALVFGSYIATDNQRLSDVDVALEFIPKEQDSQKQEELNETRRCQAETRGKRFEDFQQRQAWPEDEVYNFLQEDSCHLDFDKVAFVLEENLPYKEIYPTTDGTIVLVCKSPSQNSR